MDKTLKVVVIGGGTGQSTILRGIKQIDNIEITAIVTVADDGGSTGRLRRAYHIPAMGDIRNVMIALSESETLFSTLMSYRFEKDDLAELDAENELVGHNLGNIILTALTKKTGSFMDAVTTISKVLNVKGDIVPSTHQVVRLIARMEDGTIVEILQRYIVEEAFPVRIQDKVHNYQLIRRKLLNFESKRVRHDPERIKTIIEEIIRKNT